jgi:signal transduction histidine kinase
LHLAQTNKPTELAPTPLSPSLQAAIERLDKTAKAKKVKIENNAKNIKLKAADHSLTELIVILLDNAIKYSPAGSKVFISTAANNKVGRISIKDEGAGIKASDLPHIFDRFFRAEASRSHTQAKGYGLGLAIAKKLANSMNGVIEVNSAPSKGSVFTIILPIA